MDSRTFKLSTSQVPLKVMPGHFATNHAHVNYYLDSTTLKSRQSEARETARALVGAYVYNTVVDTIVCLEGMQVVGAYLAEKLEELAASCDIIKERRGVGLIQGLEFTVPVAPIVSDALLNQKLVLISAGANTIRFVPPLVIEEMDVDEMIEKLKKAIDSVI